MNQGVPPVKTTVVNIAHGMDWDVYIGRAVVRRRPPLAASKWANPFHITANRDREACVDAYRVYIFGEPELMAALPELKGKRLGCWCYPKACHGDVLAALVEALP